MYNFAPLKICLQAKFQPHSSNILQMASNLVFRLQNNLTTRLCFLKKIYVPFCANKVYTHRKNFNLLAQIFSKWHPIWSFGRFIILPPDGAFWKKWCTISRLKKYSCMQNLNFLAQIFSKWHPIWFFGRFIISPPQELFEKNWCTISNH